MTQQSPNQLQILDMQFSERKSEFQAVLPANCTFEKFARIVKTAAIQTPDLLNADRASLFMSCFKSAQDGLLPDGRESALVIYNTKQNDGSYKKLVQYMPMVAGILKKIRNSGELFSLSAHVVYENDNFDYQLGDDEFIKHKPAMNNRGNAILAYAIVKTKDDAIYREVMSVAEIEAVRNISKAKNSPPWVKHWPEMAKKTVIRRLSKLLPMSSDLEDVINRDNEMFKFDNSPVESNTISNTLDTINRHVIDISDCEELESIETELLPENQEIEVPEDLVKQAEEFYRK